LIKMDFCPKKIYEEERILVIATFTVNKRPQLWPQALPQGGAGTD
jgi:hypothetical protein